MKTSWIVGWISNMTLKCLSDAEIRQALRSEIQQRHPSETQVAYIEELGICRGRARIDMAVIDGLLHGYEIKSDLDSLRRLPSQVETYSKVVDRATIVVGDRHLDESLATVPAWWGVLQAESGSKGVRLKTIRQGYDNPRVEARSLVELLWLDDAISLLAQRGASRGVRSKPRRIVWDRVCERLELSEIADAVRSHLRARAMLQDPA